ncbi:hypothetical protein ACOSQ4_014630 [Xanthoceras sorbifolium]
MHSGSPSLANNQTLVIGDIRPQAVPNEPCLGLVEARTPTGPLDAGHGGSPAKFRREVVTNTLGKAINRDTSQDFRKDFSDLNSEIVGGVPVHDALT